MSNTLMSPRTSILIKNDEDENSIMTCCLTSFICLFGLAFIGSVVTWWIFAVIALTNFNNNFYNNQCQDSNLWIILLIWVILIGWSLFLAKNHSNKNQDKENDLPITTIVCGLLPSLAILVWTAISIFNPCVINHFESNRIYLLLKLIFYLDSSIILLFIIISLGICIYGCCSISKKPVDKLENINSHPSILMEEKLTNDSDNV